MKLLVAYTVFFALLGNMALSAENLRSVKVVKGRAKVTPLNPKTLLPRCYQEVQSLPEIKEKVERADRLVEKITEMTAELSAQPKEILEGNIKTIALLTAEVEKLKKEIKSGLPEKFHQKDRVRIYEFSFSNPEAIPRATSPEGREALLDSLPSIVNKLNLPATIDPLSGKPQTSGNGSKAPISSLRVSGFSKEAGLNNPLKGAALDEFKSRCQSMGRMENRHSLSDQESPVQNKDLVWTVDPAKGLVQAKETVSMADSCVLNLSGLSWAMLERRRVIKNISALYKCEYETGLVLFHYTQGSERIDYPPQFNDDNRFAKYEKEAEEIRNPPTHDW